MKKGISPASGEEVLEGEDVVRLPLSKGDGLILAVLLVIGGSVALVNHVMLRGQAPGAVAIVELDGVVQGEISLAINQDLIDIPHNRGYSKLSVEDGRVKMACTDCPRQYCVHQGWIQWRGQMLVCLPYMIVVRISDEGDADLRLDGMTN